MLILGIDPGTATTGYGAVIVENGKAEALDWGLIETDKTKTIYARLLTIHTRMVELLAEFKPNVLAIEKIFFATNAKTAISVGQAQGVMFLAAANTDSKVFEYAPGTIKKMVAGDGRADKKVIQSAIREVFGARVRSAQKKRTHFDNAADALAVALCHAYSVNATKRG